MQYGNRHAGQWMTRWQVPRLLLLLTHSKSMAEFLYVCMWGACPSWVIALPSSWRTQARAGACPSNALRPPTEV
jgi:hypothetical protein